MFSQLADRKRNKFSIRQLHIDKENVLNRHAVENHTFLNLFLKRKCFSPRKRFYKAIYAMFPIRFRTVRFKHENAFAFQPMQFCPNFLRIQTASSRCDFLDGFVIGIVYQINRAVFISGTIPENFCCYLKAKLAVTAVVHGFCNIQITAVLHGNILSFKPV